MFAAHRKWVVLGAWVLLIAGTTGLVQEFGANTSNNLELPGTGSQSASDLLAERFPPQQNGANPIIFRTPDGEKVTDSPYKQAITSSYEAMKDLPDVFSATSPFSQKGGGQISKDEETAFISVLLDIGSEDLTEPIAQSFVKAAEPGRKAGMEVAAGGSIGSELSEPATESSEVVGLVAAMIILAFTFGTLVAMGLPLLTAVFGLGVGLSLIGLLGHVTEVPTIAPTLATMIGLGVGIDYALFMVSRYRSERGEGLETPDAIARAVATSGTAIVFAGGTVIIALVSLMVAGIPLVTSLGYASAVAVLTAVLGAITLLPALMALVGRHIDSFALPAFLRPKPTAPRKGFWGAWATFVTSKPKRAVALARADPAASVDPLQLARARPGGHRRDAEGHHRAPGLRPAVLGLRSGLQRASARRRRSGEPRGAEQHLREAIREGSEPPGPAGGGADPGRDAGRVASELRGGARGRAGAPAQPRRTPWSRRAPGSQTRRLS